MLLVILKAVIMIPVWRFNVLSVALNANTLKDCYSQVDRIGFNAPQSSRAANKHHSSTIHPNHLRRATARTSCVLSDLR